MPPPKVFISYSHDSPHHKRWVLDLATRLRNAGVDAILDQWELGPGDDLPHFMERNLREADRVIMVCTERYVEKANAGAGGVGYEKMIVTADLLRTIDSNKVIPVIRQEGTKGVPTFLSTKIFVDFSNDDEFEVSFDELARALLNAPLFAKPEIGDTPFKPASETPVDRTHDQILALMRLVVADFESGSDWCNYQYVLDRSQTSRLYLDSTIAAAKAQGLITQDPDKDLRITEKGKQFAIHHRLHK